MKTVNRVLLSCSTEGQLFKLIKLIFLCSGLVLLGACSSGQEYDIVSGEWVTLEGKVGVRFDIGGGMYRLLPEESETLLIENYVLERSENIMVHDPHVHVTLEDIKENKEDTTVSYQIYYLNVKFDVMAPEGYDRQTHAVRFSFPSVLSVRDALEAIQPIDEPTVIFRIQSFSSKADLAATQWWRKAMYAIGLVVVAAFGIALAYEDSEWGIVALGAAVVSLYYWFLTLRTLWSMSPIVSLVVGVAVILGLVQIVRHL